MVVLMGLVLFFTIDISVSVSVWNFQVSSEASFTGKFEKRFRLRSTEKGVFPFEEVEMYKYLVLS